MRILDLSHPLEQGMPCYPGTPEARFQPISSIAHDGFAEQMLTISSHTGTHVDLPSHILENAPSLDAFDLSRFAGKGAVLDVRGAVGGVITIELLQLSRSIIEDCEFLLLFSDWSKYWGTPPYFERYPVLSADAAEWLAGFKLKGVGVDMVSVDAADSTDFPVHKILLRQDILILENLAGLQSLLSSPFTLCAFPLKLAKGEASPVRAVAVLEW